MTFWKTLRWAGALIFLLMIFTIWLGVDHSSDNRDSADPPARPAPVIVR